MNIKECSVLEIYNLLKFFLLLALANLIDYALKCILSSLGCTKLFYLIILFVITFAIAISIIFTMEQAVAIVRIHFKTQFPRFNVVNLHHSI